MAEPNPYELFLEPDAREQARVMADLLRGRRRSGNLALLTGDRVLAPYGAAQLQRAEAGERSLGAAGQESAGARLRTALQTSQQQFQGQEGARDRGLRRALADLEMGAQKERADAAAKLAAQKQGMETEEGLRKELMGNPVTKAAQEVASAFRNIQGAPGGGAGDMSLLYSYLRLLDPGSTVREGEFATAGKAGGLPGQLQGYFNQLTAQGFLDDATRQQIKSEAGRLFQTRVKGYGQLKDSYRGLATGAGVDPSRVAPDIGLGGEEVAPAAASPSPARPRRTDPATGETREWDGQKWVPL